jgi:transcriptional regulator with XRE-family HTH domain
MDHTPVAPSNPSEHVGIALARMRRAAGVSGDELGRRVGVSQATVSRIENGRSPADPALIGRLAHALGAPDDVVRDLMNRAVLTQGRLADWQPSSISIARTQRSIGRREEQIRELRCFEAAIIHGLLQTSEYARALLRAFQFQEEVVAGESANPAVSVAEALSARVGRQEVLTDPSKSFRFVMAEAVLSNTFCPPVDMLGQIERLRDLAEQAGNVSIRIVPASARTAVPPLHGFEIFDTESVMVDTFNTSLTSVAEADILLYQRVFEEFDSNATAEIGPILDSYQDHYTQVLLSGR